MTTKGTNILKTSIRKCSSKLVFIVFFSLFINLLMFVAPLHMLQMYDRVLVSRSEVTLLVLTFLAVCLLVIYGLLEGVRTRILNRIGLEFDELMSGRVLIWPEMRCVPAAPHNIRYRLLFIAVPL